MKKTKQKQIDKRAVIVKHLQENFGSQDNNDQYAFECKRGFETLQVFGGDMPNYRKIRRKNKNALCKSSPSNVPTRRSRLYQYHCKICLKKFEKGEMLCGHMNKHRLKIT